MGSVRIRLLATPGDSLWLWLYSVTELASRATACPTSPGLTSLKAPYPPEAATTLPRGSRAPLVWPGITFSGLTLPFQEWKP